MEKKEKKIGNTRLESFYVSLSRERTSSQVRLLVHRLLINKGVRASLKRSLAISWSGEQQQEEEEKFFQILRVCSHLEMSDSASLRVSSSSSAVETKISIWILTTLTSSPTPGIIQKSHRLRPSGLTHTNMPESSNISNGRWCGWGHGKEKQTNFSSAFTRYATLEVFLPFFSFASIHRSEGFQRFGVGKNSLVVLFTYSPVYLRLPLEAWNARREKNFQKLSLGASLLPPRREVFNETKQIHPPTTFRRNENAARESFAKSIFV